MTNGPSRSARRTAAAARSGDTLASVEVMLRIAIVDPTDLTREPLRNLLLGMESLWMEAEGSRYEFFPDIVEQSKPDVAIIALDADQGKALQLISRLKSDHPKLPILAISAKGDGQSILQALRGGGQGVLDPACGLGGTGPGASAH